MQKIYFILLFIIFTFSAFSQTITIKGQVLDEDTQEGIPFCDLYFEGTTIGTSTDMDGFYEISTDENVDSISVSTMGYATASKGVSKAAEQTINFRMVSSEFALTEVVVSAGENPANAIVRGIIANKKKNRIDNLDAYECEVYSKLELDLDNIERLKNTKLMKPFGFVFENVDSISDEKPYLPAYILEEVYDVFHVKGQVNPKEMIRASKVSGVENATVNDFLSNAQTEYNIYDNWIDILEKPFASPFSKMGLFYYEYYIQDSTMIGDKKAIQLKFKPKRKQENTFFGTFWVMSDSYAIQRLNMRMSPDVNINLVSRIIIFEEYYLEQDSIWLPKKQKTVIDFTANEKKKRMGMIGRKTLSYKDFVINKPEAKAEYKEKDPEDFSYEEIEKDDEYWSTARHEKLSENEQKIYEMVDSIKNVPVYKTYVDILQTLFTGFKEFGPIQIGPLFSMYSIDPVQGHRLKLGIGTSKKLSKKYKLYGYAAYGFKDKKVKYGGDFVWVFNRKPRAQLEASYYDDVSFSSENSEDFSTGNLLTGIYRKKIHLKLIHIREGKIAMEKYWKKGWSNRLVVLHRHLDPYGGLNENGGGFNYQYLPNPDRPTEIDTTISSAEVILSLRYAFKERVIDGAFKRTSLGSQYPIVELQYTKGIKGIFGSEYNYHKLLFGIRGYFNVNPIGWTSVNLKAGKTFGQVPFLLTEIHPGNESYTYNKTALNGAYKYEFASDFFGSLIIDHHFDGFILNKIPYIRKLNWRTVATFRTIWGRMSAENLAANQLNYSDPSLDGKKTYTGFTTPNKYPYMETGVGIENIFKFIRVDVLWRLNYLENPDVNPLTFRLGMDFYF